MSLLLDKICRRLRNVDCGCERLAAVASLEYVSCVNCRNLEVGTGRLKCNRIRVGFNLGNKADSVPIVNSRQVQQCGCGQVVQLFAAVGFVRQHGVGCSCLLCVTT